MSLEKITAFVFFVLLLFLLFVTAGKYVESGLPNITGGCGALHSGVWGAFKQSTRTPWRAGQGSWYPESVDFDASLSNNIYGKSNTVQPASLTVCYFIKY